MSSVHLRPISTFVPLPYVSASPSPYRCPPWCWVMPRRHSNATLPFPSNPTQSGHTSDPLLALPDNGDELSQLLLQCCAVHSGKTQLDGSAWRNSANVVKRHNIGDVVNILDKVARNPRLLRQFNDNDLQQVFGSLACVNRQYLRNAEPGHARVYNDYSGERGIGRPTFYNVHTFY
ncbi:hypothetical protein F5144DRAFT_85569 [Chaetomium tenue]|uniref:Uncharacterized protein n=1 Tax=Chaetomium tenue TaxID=1854479 RepID=A0ACB7PQL6_9PEZI|nr:hypothetical protein F5144DRAFT_85569 [Chaetomium globosum]